MRNPALIRDVIGFGEALRRYLRVMLALLIQEEENRRRAPMETILSILEPAFLIASIMMLRALFERSGPSGLTSPIGGSLLLFYATGFFPKYLFIYISLKKIQRAVGARRGRFPVEQRLDDLIVHVVLRVIDYAVMGVLVFGGMYFFGIDEAIPYQPFLIIPAVAAVAALGFGWGMFNVVMRRFFWFWHFIQMGLNRAMIIMSGCLFVPDFLAPGPRYWISFNPEMHAISLFRMAFYPHYPHLLLDTSYMAYCAIGAVLFGLALERVTRRVNIR